MERHLELIQRLEKVDTCAVSDALDHLGLKGAVIGIKPVWQCPRIVGRVVTVKIDNTQPLKRSGELPKQ